MKKTQHLIEIYGFLSKLTIAICPEVCYAIGSRKGGYTMAIVWFIFLIAFIFAEAATVAVVSVWFAAGTLAAMIAALLGAALWLQIGIFLVVSVGLLLLLRPVTEKLLKPRIKRTNLDAVIGSEGVVTKTIDNTAAQGQVKLGAMEWTARSTSGTEIPAGTRIRVDRIEGVKVFVSPVLVEVS